MGYTHYWRREKLLDSARFVAAVKDCERLCANLPIQLGDAFGEGEPVFDGQRICFNGHKQSNLFARDAGTIPWPDDNASGYALFNEKSRVGTWCVGTLLGSRSVNEYGDGSYETFCVHRVLDAAGSYQQPEDGMYFEFCKTAFRPYDLNVQACLVVLRHHLGNSFKVESDGTDAQWNEARHICQQHLGYGNEFALAA